MDAGSTGLRRGIVRVVPYDPDSPVYFKAEQELIRDALGVTVLDTRYIGSTVIPGMLANPTIPRPVRLNSRSAPRRANGNLTTTSTSVNVPTTITLMNVD